MAVGYGNNGLGARLPRASSNPQEPVWAAMREAEYTIPDSDSSMGVPANAGTMTEFNIEFNGAPTTNAVQIMYAVTPDFANEIILETIPATTDLIYVWTTQGIRLSGHLRVTNVGTETINNVWYQQTVANYG